VPARADADVWPISANRSEANWFAHWRPSRAGLRHAEAERLGSHACHLGWGLYILDC
jgi:hypothetical protein